ncbi:MAG: c-type cytochrome [Acidimicrobiales bacterium]
MTGKAWPWLLLLGLAVAGCSYFSEDRVAPYRPPVYYGPPTGHAVVDAGQQLYQRDCAFCHGDEGDGTARGPALTGGTSGPALVDFVLRTGRMPVEGPIEQMRARDPVYDEGQIAAIVAFVTREFHPPGPEIPHIDPRRGHLAEGQQVYQEHCAACHATTGIGGAMLLQAGDQVPGPALGIVIPELHGSEPIEVAEAVRAGPGSMPVFGTRAITDEELDSLLSYVEYLRNPDDEGGAPIGRVGPVVEGGVGWLVGLGVLILVIRWMGTKAGEVT